MLLRFRLAPCRYGEGKGILRIALHVALDQSLCCVWYYSVEIVSFLVFLWWSAPPVLWFPFARSLRVLVVVGLAHACSLFWFCWLPFPF